MILILEPDTDLATAMGELLFDDGFEICIADSLKYAIGQMPVDVLQGGHRLRPARGLRYRLFRVERIRRGGHLYGERYRLRASPLIVL